MSRTRVSEEAFTQAVNDLLNRREFAFGKVLRKDYDDFCKEYIFDVLKHSEPFGVAFCRKFDLGDYMLTKVYKNDIMKCKEIIEESGYINDTRSN